MYDPIPAISPYFQPGAADPMGVIAQAQGLQSVGDNIFMGRGGAQSYDAMRSGFQRATGDATADIFAGLGDRNIARIYNQNAANYNGQFTGGARPVVTPSAAVAATAAGRPAAPIAMLQTHAQRNAAATAAIAGLENVPTNPRYGPTGGLGLVAQENELAYKMEHPEYDSSLTSASPAHQAVLRSLGVYPPSDQHAFDVFDRTGSLPQAPQYTSEVERNPVSPQYGLDAKVYNDPKFQAMLRNAPNAAAVTYEKLTGVPFATAQKVLVARHADREKFDDTMVNETLQNNVYWDPKQGWMERRSVRKPADRYALGNKEVEYQDVDRPVSAAHKQWLDSDAFERKTGIRLRERGAQTAGPAASPLSIEAAEKAELAMLQAKGGKSANTVYDDNPAFNNMVQGFKDEYGPVPAIPSFPWIPRSMLNPEIRNRTLSNLGDSLWNLGAGAMDIIGTGASAYPR